MDKCRLTIKYFNTFLFNKLVLRFLKKLKKCNISFKGFVSMPKKREIFNILRSPNTHKDSRDQIQIISYKKIIDLYNLDSNKLKKIEKFLSTLDMYYDIKSL